MKKGCKTFSTGQTAKFRHCEPPLLLFGGEAILGLALGLLRAKAPTQ
jgi:hypothetical protein